MFHPRPAAQSHSAAASFYALRNRRCRCFQPSSSCWGCMQHGLFGPTTTARVAVLLHTVSGTLTHHMNKIYLANNGSRGGQIWTLLILYSIMYCACCRMKQLVSNSERTRSPDVLRQRKCSGVPSAHTRPPILKLSK